MVAEITGARVIPDGKNISAEIKSLLGIDVAVIAFVAPKSLPRTSSGKIMRYMVKRMWIGGDFTVLSRFEPEAHPPSAAMQGTSTGSMLEFIKTRYALSGRETGTLAEAGVDSLDLVTFAYDLKSLVVAHGGTALSDSIDSRLAQQVPIASLFELIERFEKAPASAIEELLPLLSDASNNFGREERAEMSRDRSLAFTPAPVGRITAEKRKAVLLTGGTGFLGPFLLRSLLEQTSAKVHVLVRASSGAAGIERLRESLIATGAGPRLLTDFHRRTTAVCGDLGNPNLGLSSARWQQLADSVDVIYHNGAAVKGMSRPLLNGAAPVRSITLPALASVHCPTMS